MADARGSVTALLAAESIGKRFGRRDVLTSAGLWAYPGRVTVLVGRNGAGKTTLVRIAAGWVAPDHGVVIFDGHRFTRPRLARLAHLGLFYLPERSLLCRWFTLRAHFAAVARRRAAADVDGAVAAMHLDGLLDRRPPTLSVGEARRAEIALALARSPRCLLADEPFLGIMPADAELVAGAFRALAATGCAVVVTGHETSTLFALGDDVLWQTAGTTHALGAPSDAVRHDQFRREYLGTLTSPPGPLSAGSERGNVRPN